MAEIKVPKKLIEVALPLDAINAASAREKSIRHGHPSTLHLWWARRPLAAARAVIFGQMVNDPSWKWEMEHPSQVPPSNLKANWASNRKRIFGIIEELVKWENTTNEAVLEKARAEIRKSWREVCELNKDHPQAAELFNPDKLPAFHDPFAGGGAIPLEAQRLGLESYASDLNPVAVTINKAMIEIPPRFEGRKPVGPVPENENQAKLVEDWSGAKGLAEDVRRYGAWLRTEAQKRIGHLYPQIEISAEMVKARPDLKPLLGQKFPVIAWIWARTVKSPSPAHSSVEVPLVSSFYVSRKPGKEVWVEPKFNEGTNRYDFIIRTSGAPKLEHTVNRKGAICISSGVPIDFPYIRNEGKAGRIGQRLMAVALEGRGGRVYVSPDADMEKLAFSARPSWTPNTSLPAKALGFRVQEYGMTKHSDLFTSRQLMLLSTLSDLVAEVHPIIAQAARDAGLADDSLSLDKGGIGATAYADAICVYLALGVSRQANYSSTLCVWSSHPKDELVKQVFMRHALAMTWDFAESNPLGTAGGSLDTNFSFLSKAIPRVTSSRTAHVRREDATVVNFSGKVVSTDPPYFDNVGYADLSDFFYIWLQQSLGKSLPYLFQTDLVPKREELIASVFRHESWEKAEAFFYGGMTRVMTNLARQAHPAFPVTIYYAFKQSETNETTGTSNTGWDTFLEAVIRAGFSIHGTWPIRTELVGNLKKVVNALASSIVLVCRNRPAGAPTISRREFIRELNAALPEALSEMTQGTGDGQSPIAPVDLSQAIIGPGMAIFSKYSAVLEANGKPMSVQTALQLINRFIAEDDFDHDTQFCLSWFDGHGWDQGQYGQAEVLATAKGISVDGLKQGGVVETGTGRLRLLRASELPEDWTPETDTRISVWEILHHLIRRLGSDGESSAGDILSKTSRYSENIRTLAYRLYTLCERKGWAQDAGQYNTLILAWDAIEASARSVGYTGTQHDLFGESEPKAATKKMTTRKKK